MRIPPHWAKGFYTDTDKHGREQTFTAWGWSFDSMAEAQANARTRASRIFNHFHQGTDLERYPYGVQPIREEMVESITLNGQEIGLITRNRYGALVLNTSSVLFADIDFPQAKAKGLLSSIFGRSKDETPETTTIQAVKAWAYSNPRRSFRMYRTAAGLRLLFTDQLYDPSSGETDSLLQALNSDPLYRQLTKNQQSFRARLTPKPWRCQCPNPPHEYPWADSREEQEYRHWQRTYEDKSRSYKTCFLLEVVGQSSLLAEIDKIVQIHDQYTLTNSPNLA